MNKAIIFVVVPAIIAMVIAQVPLGGPAGGQFASQPFGFGGLNPYGQLPGYYSAVNNYNVAQRANRNSQLFTLFTSFLILSFALNLTGNSIFG